MRLLVLIAGTNNPSNSATLAETFVDGVKEAVPGMEVTMLRIKDLRIEHFTIERYIPTCTPEDDFCTIQELVIDAAGMVIATPIWNFSVPAHLKNIIDRIGAFALDQETHSKGQLKGKPVFLIYTGGAPLIAWKALMYLTTVHVAEAFKYYGAVIIGRYFEPRCLVSKGVFGLVVDKRPRTLETMRRSGRSFAKIVKTFAETGQLPLSTRIIRSIFTFFYRVGNRIMYPISTKQ